MRVIVVGAGPIGLVAGAGLARRGHRVVVVDRDGGPSADGAWNRRGVMQFQHAHGFRPQVAEVLGRQWPEAYRSWLELGAEPKPADGPDGCLIGVFSRRVTFERALRRAAAMTPGLEMRQGHVDGLVVERGRVLGARVDGVGLDGDLVVDASGRSGRVSRHDGSVVGGPCGIAYVNRTYRRLPGVDPGPLTSPVSWAGSFDGYGVYAFPHERRHFSVVFIRPAASDALKDLRHLVAFEAACRAIPALAVWTDPASSTPTGPVIVGGALRNTYRRQLAMPGLVSVGDSVATTAPTAGRGVAMGMLQVEALLGLIDESDEPRAVAGPFGDWCDRQMLPWVEDHIRTDDDAARRWQGADVDLTLSLPSDLVVAAAEVDHRIGEIAGPYLAMTALPASLQPAEPLAREVFRTGWRPPFSEGPTADELVELIHATSPAAA